MRKSMRRRSQKMGLPPGSLVHVGNPQDHQVRLSFLEYDEKTFIEENNVSLEACLSKIETPLMTWIQVHGVYDPLIIGSLGARFNLHALILEDILNTTQRAKLDTYRDQIFVVMRLLKYGEAALEIKDEQLSFIFGPNYLISFLETDDDFFAPIKERLRHGNNRLRKEKSDYLAYALLDLIVDQYFVVLEQTDANLDRLEEELLHFPFPGTMKKILQAKREMIFLRKCIWPMRDVLNRFQKLEPPLVSRTSQIYLRDVYDHLIQVIDIVEGFRDVAAGLTDVYLSNINSRTNEIMKVLTIVSTIFVPLTFLSSLYGMNFDFMPELHYRWSYPLVLGLMVTLAGGMLHYFHKKNWI